VLIEGDWLAIAQLKSTAAQVKDYAGSYTAS